MELKVNRKPIDEWVDTNGPDGVFKLAQRAGVSASYLMKIRNGLVPKKRSTRLKISGALMMKEDVLFCPSARGKAS